MEVPIAMIVLSRYLAYGANRWANIGAGTLKTAAVLATFFVGSPTSYYLFFGTVEVVTTIAIVGLAARWPRQATINKLSTREERQLSQ